jgi:hypothetical protein
LTSGYYPAIIATSSTPRSKTMGNIIDKTIITLLMGFGAIAIYMTTAIVVIGVTTLDILDKVN